MTRKYWLVAAIGLASVASAQQQMSFSAIVPRGAALYTVDSTEIMSSAARTLSEVLQARVPGLSVLRSGGVSAQGAQVRSRGTRSFYMSSEPIVIVDGMRVDASQDATVLDVNVSTSRLDDIALEDIARIDVLPGAAAASLYGPGAAGGALLITTKRGAPGFHVGGRVESGLGDVHATWTPNYQLDGVSTTTGQPMRCILSTVAAGECAPTQLSTWNPLEKASPFRSARMAGGNVSLTGGVDQTAARIALTGGRTLGVTPDDDNGRVAVRARLDQHFGKSFVVGGNLGYFRSSAALPVRGNIIDGSNVVANGLFGSAFPDTLDGYRPTSVFTSTREYARHSSAAANVRWEIFDALTATALYGRDQVNENDDSKSIVASNPFAGGLSEEFGRFNHGLTSIDITLSTKFWPLFHPLLRTQTIAGYRQLRSVLDATAEGSGGGAAELLRSRMAAPVVRQQFVWADRFFLGLGGRWDHVSGMHVPSRFFKTADASWWVEHALHLDSLRLRAAYGEARNWSPGDPSRVGASGSFSGLFSELLPPEERVAETEAGFDFTFADGSFSFTAFRADASHLYALAILPPGAGGNSSADIAAGALRNEGVEVASNLLLLQLGQFRWDATLRASTLRDRVRETGPANPALVGSYDITRPGDPVSSYYQSPYTYADANHDGLIGVNEVQGLGGPVQILGSSLPSREASLTSTFRLSPSMTFIALLDYRGGQKLANLNEYIRCHAYLTCRAENDRTASLADQAHAIAGSGPTAEDASFLKLRELSLRYVLPARAATLLGSPMSVTIAGRNLATWTRYSGADPEVNEQPLNMLPRLDVAQTPLLRELLVRLDFGGTKKSN